MISSIKDKLNNINYDVTTGNRNAGVMILLSKISDKNFSIKFTLRSSKMKTHAGEVSFPGGMMEEVDQDIFQTALRECEEEINLQSTNLEILGKMDYFISRHKVEVHPVVGFLETNQAFKSNYEIDEKNWFDDVQEINGTKFKNKVEFKNISYRYKEQNFNTFNKINIEIKTKIFLITLILNFLSQSNN